MKVAVPLLCLLSFGAVTAREPGFDVIKRDQPERYVYLPRSLGEAAAIKRQAAELRGDSGFATIRNVLAWMGANLTYDGQKAYSWRNYDDVIREKAYGGCADESIVCGALLKATGVPVVWVKTMDVEWVWNLKKGRPFQNWSGHVFLEVYLEKKWMLLDVGARQLYKDYQPSTRILPGNRFAYDKGSDPKTMIMSLQWEPWKKQTEKYFRSLDESMLPVDAKGATGLRSNVYVAANSPYYLEIGKAAAKAGYSVKKSFNTEFDTFLPMARGHVLLIETHKGVPIIPSDALDRYFPGAGAQSFPGVSFKVDGTTIIFVECSGPQGDLELDLD